MLSLLLVVLSAQATYTFQFRINDLLRDVDQFFDSMAGKSMEEIYEKTEEFKHVVERSYGLTDHTLDKRSIHEKTIVKRGVNDLRKVARVPARIPSDIRIVSAHNGILYVAALESDEGSVQAITTNQLVLYKIKEDGFVYELARTTVVGGCRLACFTFKNVTYILPWEHETDNMNQYEVSSLYSVVHNEDDTILEKIQILNITLLRDVKFWQHQDQMYLAIVTGKSNSILIYKWLVYNFDLIQKIDCRHVKNISPFIIGSSMYLASANHQQYNGNTNIDSFIFRFHVQSEKFRPHQRIRRPDASNISYFKLSYSDSNQQEHFLIIDNLCEMECDGVHDDVTGSILYKFEGDYFVPFQYIKLEGVLQWVPVQGLKNELLLLGVCPYAIVGYQFDGWRFEEVTLDFGQNPFDQRIVSINPFNQEKDVFLSVTSEASDGIKGELWQIMFEYDNFLEKQQNEVENWCVEMRSRIESVDLDAKIKKLHSYIQNDIEPNFLGVKMNIKEAEIETLETESFDVYDGTMVDNLNTLNKKVKLMRSHLQEINENLEKSKFVVYHDVTGFDSIPYLKLSCRSKDCCSFENLNIITLNSVDFVSFLNNAVTLNENIMSSKLEFENINIMHNVAPVEINGHPADTLIDTERDWYINSQLVVNGSIIIQGDLTVNSKYLKSFRSEDDLLMETFDDFTGELIVEMAKVKHLEISGKLNGENIGNLFQNNTSDIKDNFSKLSIHDLYVDGIINNLNSSTERRSSLNEDSGSEFNFEVLEVDEVWIESGELSGIEISDLIHTEDGELYEIDGELNITAPCFQPDYIEIRESINDVSVDDWLNQTEADEPHVIVVKGMATVEDIMDPTGNHSMLNIINNGLLLNSSIISSKLEFEKAKINELVVKFINGVPVDSLVWKNLEQAQMIRGKKTFIGDVDIRKRLVVHQLNGTDLEKLFNDTLYLDGDQTVSGNMSFNEITTESLDCDNIIIGKEKLVPQQQDLKVFGSVVVDNLIAENVTVNGPFIAEDYMGELIEDRLDKGSMTTNSIYNDDFDDLIEYDVYDDIRLNSSLEIDELIFDGSLDSLERSKFGSEWLLSEGDQTIYGSITFMDVDLKRGATLKNETVNNVNLRHIFEDSVKVNDSAHFKYLAINNVRAKEISVLGTVNGAKFEDSVVLAKSELPQVIEGEWFLNKDFIVEGNFFVEGFYSGMNLTQLCSMIQSEPEEINLFVAGSVQFDKEPEILVDVNGHDLGEIVNRTWFKNEDVTLDGGLKKFCDVELHDKVNLRGYLNDMKLENLSKNYFSKTLTRIVPVNVTVEHLLIRESSRMHNVTVDGRVNGIDLKEWSKTVLLQDVDQVITGRYHFHHIIAEDLILNGTVNGLDLTKDVVRQDVPNAIVTGKKTFLNLSVGNLTMKEGQRVQEVSIAEWARRMVTKHGNHNITASLVLLDPIFNNGLKVSGKVNNLIFDPEHIFVTEGNQTVTGKKTFDLRKYPNETLTVRHLSVKGAISGVDLDSLIKNQAKKDESMTFTGRMNFSGQMTAEELNVEGLFESENITTLCEDLSEVPQLPDIAPRYQDLLETADNIIKHFKEGPFFLDYYELLQTMGDNVFAVLPYPFAPEGLISVVTLTDMRLMEWDPFAEQFVYKDDQVLNFVNNVTFATSGTTRSMSFLYLEISEVSKIFSPKGHIQLDLAGTSCVTPFELTALNKTCFFVGRLLQDSRIVCYGSDLNDTQTYQTLPITNCVQASTLIIGEQVYLIVIHKEVVVDRLENVLTAYKYDKAFHNFYKTSTILKIHPVAVSTITYKNHNFLALAGGHLSESVDTSIVTIFRLNRENDALVRYQSLLVDYPADVHFAILPTSELVLYVLSSNPAKPFIVFIHRGILGFVEETSGPLLYVGDKIDSCTNADGDHWVFISGNGRGQILQAGFKGNKRSNL